MKKKSNPIKLSLSYYITLLVIKLKGIKKDFSKDPIDYKKIRKSDILCPKDHFFGKNQLSRFEILDTKITEITKDNQSDRLLIFIHGGAFISGPSKHHWDAMKTLVKRTNHTIWMCDYPKSPEHEILEISENIDLVYRTALEKYQSNQISLIGDSAGGTLITALIQRLILNNTGLPLKIILISPVMDATYSHPQIEAIDSIDPMLSREGVYSAKKMCAGSLDLENTMISPINGSFKKFPNTMIFIAEHDISYPDQQIVVKKLKEAKVNLQVIIGKKMPHIWPILPVMKEGKSALNEIIKYLNNE